MTLNRRVGAAIFLITFLAVFAAGQDLPKPKLGFVRVEEFVNNGQPMRMYEIEIVNRVEFANELFTASPDLPPCGKNANASRTWINIYINNNSRIYGHCGISSNEELSSLKFNVPADTKITRIAVDFVDRREGKIVRSNRIDVED